MIKKKRVTKYLEILGEIAELNDDFKKSYEQFGKRLKLGNDEDSAVGVKTAEVLRFNTSKLGDEQNNFVEYVDHMKEDQNDISYIAGENTAVVSSSPFDENLRTKGPEELHVAEPMDEYAVYQFKESGGTKLNPTTKEGLNLGDRDDKKKHEELKTELELSTKLTEGCTGRQGRDGDRELQNRRFPVCSHNVRVRLVCQNGAHHGSTGAARDNSMTSTHGVQENHGGQSNAFHHDGVEEEGGRGSSVAAAAQEQQASTHQASNTTRERGRKERKE